MAKHQQWRCAPHAKAVRPKRCASSAVISSMKMAVSRRCCCPVAARRARRGEPRRQAWAGEPSWAAISLIVSSSSAQDTEDWRRSGCEPSTRSLRVQLAFVGSADSVRRRLLFLGVSPRLGVPLRTAKWAAQQGEQGENRCKSLGYVGTQAWRDSERRQQQEQEATW